jgi:hypothetical protein
MNLVTDTALPLTRREIAKLVVFGSILGTSPLKVAFAHIAVQTDFVIGFHNDAPWLDASGRDLPYVPPIGVGARAPDSERLMRLGHFL